MTSISSDVIRGYNDTMILYLLLDAPSYGYAISKQIKDLSQEKYVIKETTLYSALHVWRKTDILLLFRMMIQQMGNAELIIELQKTAGSIIRKNAQSGR